MSTDFRLVCFTCKSESPSIFASSSIAYGYKVWDHDDQQRQWLGHREAVGHHESHDLRIVNENADLPWDSPEE